MKFKQTTGYWDSFGTSNSIIRAIAIQMNAPGQVIRDYLKPIARDIKSKKRKFKNGYKADYNVYERAMDIVLLQWGWQWMPTMQKGTGVKVHLKESELPDGNLIVRISGEYLAIQNKTILDIKEPDLRSGTRAVYGYWIIDSFKLAVAQAVLAANQFEIPYVAK